MKLSNSKAYFHNDHLLFCGNSGPGNCSEDQNTPLKVVYCEIDSFGVLGRARFLESNSADSHGRMSAHVVISDSDLEIARLEEAKRRHDVMVRSAVLWKTFVLSF